MYTIRSRYNRESIPALGAAYSGRLAGDNPTSPRNGPMNDPARPPIGPQGPDTGVLRPQVDPRGSMTPLTPDNGARGAVSPTVEQPRGAVTPIVEQPGTTEPGGSNQQAPTGPVIQFTPAQIGIISQHPELQSLIPQLQLLESQGIASLLPTSPVESVGSTPLQSAPTQDPHRQVNDVPPVDNSPVYQPPVDSAPIQDSGMSGTISDYIQPPDAVYDPTAYAPPLDALSASGVN